ncbi:MAG TPA: response regulator [Anaeromyxobacter sp.]|nr:response regulator [Anaeromyxobacter sp.]
MTTERTPPPAPEQPRVLVVDDDPLVGRMIGRVLQGFRVTFAQSATGALGRIQAGGDFQAIVCDVRMPGMSGLQFHDELARVAPSLAKRMVLLTGAWDAQIAAYAGRACVPWLPKPFAPEQLRAAVRQAARHAAK